MAEPVQQDLDRAGYLQTYLAKMLVHRRIEAAVFETAWFNAAVAEHIVTVDLRHAAAIAMLQDNLSAWEDEEDSVQEEHKRLITATRKLVFDESPLTSGGREGGA